MIPLYINNSKKEENAMKKIVFTLALILSALSIQAADINGISNAFKNGNASSIAANMDTEVDIAVPGTSKKGSGSDAVSVLNQFFQANKPSGFTVAHHADKNESGFIVGKLATNTKEFRVNITYTIKENKVLIQSIRIE